ncbi:MAG TPA: MBL fold metallo-hydrolase [Xanthobacteraceae bacterium]|nr:MBL fold metallo-hydrolase [Xanthobacteraceae bacterium]
MRLTVVGSGDAFGSGGRFNTCFRLESAATSLLIDCGASVLTALRARGIEPNQVDGVIITHLHGDHFGGLPFFLIDAQHMSRRQRPFIIAGPPGTRARLAAAMEVLFPDSTATRWRFPWEVIEITPGEPCDFLGYRLLTTAVVHPSGAPSTALRLSDGRAIFAYSGDTEWTDALSPIANGASLFIVECSGYTGRISYHLTWEILKSRLPQLRAQRIMVTHMNPTVLAHLDEIRAAGVLVAADGDVIEL